MECQGLNWDGLHAKIVHDSLVLCWEPGCSGILLLPLSVGATVFHLIPNKRIKNFGAACFSLSISGSVGAWRGTEVCLPPSVQLLALPPGGGYLCAAVSSPVTQCLPLRLCKRGALVFVNPQVSAVVSLEGVSWWCYSIICCSLTFSFLWSHFFCKLSKLKRSQKLSC